MQDGQMTHSGGVYRLLHSANSRVNRREQSEVERRKMPILSIVYAGSDLDSELLL